MGAGGATRFFAIAAASVWVLCGGAALAGEVLSYGGNFGLPIPGAAGQTRGWMADAAIQIGEHHIVKDVDVRLSITHASVFDLQIFVQSPAGAAICLNSYDIYDGYFRAANYAGTIFDDEAAIAIEDGAAPFAGSFRPEAGNWLSVFDDTDCFGTWKLRIYDAYYGDAGTLDSFELMITNPEPATGALLMLGMLLMRKKPAA